MALAALCERGTGFVTPSHTFGLCCHRLNHAKTLRTGYHAPSGLLGETAHIDPSYKNRVTKAQEQLKAARTITQNKGHKMRL